MGCILRLSIVTEHHGKPYNDNEFNTAFQLVVNSLLGENGFGDWMVGNETGFWIKRGIVWEGKINLSSCHASIQLPFRTIKTIVKAYDLTNGQPTVINYYVNDANTIYPTALVGKPVQIEVSLSKIAKE